jgi:hypothetical protein
VYFVDILKPSLYIFNCYSGNQEKNYNWAMCFAYSYVQYKKFLYFSSLSLELLKSYIKKYALKYITCFVLCIKSSGQRHCVLNGGKQELCGQMCHGQQDNDQESFFK